MYLIAGGAGSADINAGTTVGAAQATTTNGNWNSGTGVFIAASGTPFAATVVGDYASIYNDGVTITGFVGKVTTVTSSTQITVDVTTLKYGASIPTTSATGRSCTINGSWNTEQVLAAGGLGTHTVPQATKVNITGNLTVTANRIFGMTGTTTVPVWWSGYNTSPGDLDADTTNSLTKPLWTCNSTVTLTFTLAFGTISSLRATGSVSGALWTNNANAMFTVRCRSENTSANAAAIAYATAAAVMHHAYCWFKAPTTATTTGCVSAPVNNCTWLGCVFEGGGLAGANCATANGNTFIHSIFLNNTGSGVLGQNVLIRMIHSTVYNASADGVKWTGTPAVGSILYANLFAICGGYGINQASGTNTGLVARSNNDFYSCTSGSETGFGDVPAFFGQTDAASPVISSTDMTPVNGSNARHNGFAGVFEGGGALGSQINQGEDIGAVQSNDFLAVTISNDAIFQPRQMVGY